MDSKDRRGVPRVPVAAIARPRLLQRLSEWPDLTVVHGPVSSGKTSLLAAWAATIEVPVLWWDGGAQLPLSELESQTSEGSCVLVIDRAGLVEMDQLWQLGRIADHAPQLRIVAATRSSRRVSELASTMVASLDVITADELRVTLEELRDAGRLSDDAEREALLEATGGLAGAVREALEFDRLATSGTRERTLRQLLSEFDKDPEHFAAVLKLALLPRVDLAIWDAWGMPESLFEELRDSGLTTSDGDWLRMHPFVRSVLAAAVREHMEKAERRRLMSAAVRASLLNRDPLQAMQISLKARDFVLANEIAFTNLLDLLEGCDASYAMLRKVKVAKLRDYPALVMALICLSLLKPETWPRGLQLLEAWSGFGEMRGRLRSERDRVVVRAFGAATSRFTPHADDALETLRRATGDLAALRETDFESLQRTGPFLFVQLGIAAFYLEDPELAQRSLERAYALNVEQGRADQVGPRSWMGGYAALTGDILHARSVLDAVDAIDWPVGWREGSPSLVFRFGRALLAIEDGDVEKAEACLEGLDASMEMTDHWRLIALARARTDRLAGALEAGLLRVDRLRQLRGTARGTALDESFLNAAQAELMLATGDAEGARRVALPSVRHGSFCRAVLARAELALDRPAAASMQAQLLLNSATSTPRGRLEAKLVFACAALRAGHDEDAGLMAERVAALLQSTGLRSPLRSVMLRDRGALVSLLRGAGVGEDLLEIVASEGVAQGETLIPEQLSPREQTVLVALAKTGSLDEIAEQLFVSRNTVKSQLRTVYRKLGVKSREAALIRAAVLGLVQLSSH